MASWKDGLVSVIMPAYNSEQFLVQSVRSVMAQTFSDWELLIIDDASKDQTLAISQQMADADSRIRVIPSLKNAGVANARNLGMAGARGQYLAFLDSDDLWLPAKLKTQTAFMQAHKAAFTFTQYRRFSSTGFLGSPVKVPARVDYKQLLKGNVIGCLTVMIDRCKIPDFSMLSVRHEDYVSWLQILKQGHVACGIQEDLARYRFSSTSLSGNKSRSAAWTWDIYRKIEKLSLAESTWNFLNYAARSLYVRFLG
jgi:glycosyltransferase involved in cell wall biosynthesis